MKQSNLQMKGKPRLNSVLYETNKGFNFEGSLPLEIKNTVNIIKGEEEQALEAIIVLKIDIFDKEEFADAPFKMNVEIEGCFTWDKELSEKDELLNRLLKQNAPAILYSYIRPLITLITVEASMPPLVLPLMNFQD